MSGFLPLQRNFFTTYLWKENREFSRAEAFIDMLQLAAFKQLKKIVKDCLVELESGQLCGSLRYLSGRWGWGMRRVRTFLDQLEAEKLIKRGKQPEATHVGEVITILNYECYGIVVPAKDTQPTHSRHAEDTQPTQIEEGKEGEEGKELPSARDGASSRPVRVTWSAGKGFAGITEADRERWKEAYPAVDIASQIGRASEWLRANPLKKKRDHGRSLTSWLDRAQERGGERAWHGVGSGTGPGRTGVGAAPLPPNAVISQQGYIVRRSC